MGFTALQDRRVATDEQCELTFDGALAPAVQRRVEQLGPARGKRGANVADDAGIVGRVIDHDESRSRAFENASGTQDHGAHLRRTGDTDTDDVALRRDVPRRVRPDRAALEYAGGGTSPQVVDR